MDKLDAEGYDNYPMQGFYLFEFTEENHTTYINFVERGESKSYQLSRKYGDPPHWKQFKFTPMSTEVFCFPLEYVRF